MKDQYASPEVKLVGFVSEQANAAFEFDDLLVQGLGKQDGTSVSEFDVPVTIREDY
jgi:hypothetical protein